MKALHIFIVCVIYTPFLGFSQGLYPAGARSMSMGNASVTLDDVFAFQNNPGALGYLENFSFGISYENRFLLRDLQTQSLAVAIPLKAGVVSVGGHMFGGDGFRSYKAGMGYSLKLAEKLAAGIQLNYLGLSLPEGYGSKSAFSGAIGLLADISDQWKIGFSVYNLNRAKLSDYQDDRFSTIARLGSSYKFSKKFILALELEKNVEHPLRIRSGAEYQLLDKFYLRGGFNTAPMEGSFGLGYSIKGIAINLGSAYHQILGWSPHFSLTYSTDKN